MDVKVITILRIVGGLVLLFILWKAYLFIIWKIEKKIFYRGVGNFLEKEGRKPKPAKDSGGKAEEEHPCG